MRTPGSRSARGFVLLAVLAALVVMALIATAIATLAERAIEDERALEASLDGRLAMHSTEATLLYLLASQRMTLGGLTVDMQVTRTEDEIASNEVAMPVSPIGNEIRLDGRSYRGVGPARFALQDDRGRLSPGWVDPALRSRLVAQLGGDPIRAEDLFATLVDYQDTDDLPRLNGAEAEEYRAAGLPPPPNRPLANPLELRGVLGWRDLLAPLDDAALMERFTLSRVPSVNVNTAPPIVLRSLFDVDEATARRAVAFREGAPFTSSFDVWRSTGLVVGEDGGFMVFPGQSLTIATWAPGAGARRVRQWQLTPLDDGGAPWRSEYGLRLPAPPLEPRLDALADPPAPLFRDPPAAAR